MRLSSLICLMTAVGWVSHADDVRPTGAGGAPLNLDFEAGNLSGWTAEGDAFTGQPIEGDSVARRRGDMRSGHEGRFWIGGFERLGDAGRGTLTSDPFPITHPWASFRVAGGPWPNTRVELADADSGEVFFKVSGLESETLRPVVVDLTGRKGRSMRIRLVDDNAGHWGHVNFDGFRFHSARPTFTDEITREELRRTVPPPADEVAFAGLSAADAVLKATLPEGFRMHVFASEPDIVQPIAFCEDHRGRLWVAEGRAYPRRNGNPPKDERPEGDDRSVPTTPQLRDILGGPDRILVFEDTDGDHRADRRTVFMDGLNLVSGLEVGFGGVWIGAAPYLLFVPMEDGDVPRPAGDPKILLDGWDYRADTHETLNTFTWGPDGWLYGCHGVFCPSLVGRPGAPAEERQWMDAGVWRYHPVRHEFEVFTEGGSNPWGIDFDENGELWSEMCVIPHLFHMIQGGRITRQGGQHFAVGRDEIARNRDHRQAIAGLQKVLFPHYYEDIGFHADHLHYAGNQGPHAGNGRSDSAGGGHAHAGLLCYLGTGWPETYRGALLIGNIHGQRLNLDRPERDGSGYVARHGADFLNFNDRWSQTLNQRLAPDGSVYVIDWYDQNQCHHNRVDGHDRGNGRIYKIVHGSPAAKRVDLDALGSAELAGLVTSRNEWHSRHARRVLMERVARAAETVDVQDLSPALRPLARFARAGRAIPELGSLSTLLNSKAPTPARLRALWGMHVTGTLRAEDLDRCVRDSDEMIRAWAVRLQHETDSVYFSDERWGAVAQRSLDVMVALAKGDASPRVRLAVASALQRVPADRRWPVLEALLGHGEDAGDHNLPLMYWYAAEGSVAGDPERALALLQTCRIPKVREFIARRVASMSLASDR